MVRSNTLSASLRDISGELGTDNALEDLLSDEIILKTGSNRLSFTHNILFDYALAYLLLDETNLIKFLSAAPERSLFYRPSISYFLTRLWFIDSVLFWKSVEPLFDTLAGVPATSAITPAMVIFDVAKTSDDLAPIFAMPDDHKSRAIVFVLRSVLVFDGLKVDKRALWIDFLAVVVSSMRVGYVNEVITLLRDCLQRPDLALADKTRLVALSAILLQWLWDTAESADISRAQNLSAVGAGFLIPLIVQNYAANPSVAAHVLKGVLGRFGNLRSSANEAFRVASSIEAVIESDPEIASEFFVAVLGFEDKADEETSLGGAVMPLRSNRAQDFSIARYVLEQKFQLLLNKNIAIASKTVAAAITAEVKLKEGDTVAQLSAYKSTFLYENKPSTLVSDRSDIWDHSSKDYTSLKLLERLLHWLDDEAKAGRLSAADIRSVIGTIATTNVYAVTWKRIVHFASHSVAILAANHQLFVVPEILGGPETIFSSGKAIERTFKEHIYSSEDNSAIENAILSLPETLKHVYKEARSVRDRLLGCIPESMLSEQSRIIVEGLKKSTGIPENVPSIQFGPATYGPEGEDDWLRRQGVDVERADNRSLLSASKPIQTFSSRFVNDIPSESECSSIAGALNQVFRLLESDASADKLVKTDVLTSLTGAASAIVRNQTLTNESPIIVSSKAILLKGAEYPYPEPTKDGDAHFDTPIWSPTPKIESAQGLMRYATRWGIDSTTREAIMNLSRDLSPAVRFQIASTLTGIYEKDPDDFWKIANQGLAKENATGVLVEIARSATHPFIANRERKRVLQWQADLMSRELPQQRREDVLGVLANSLTQLYVFMGDEDARKLLIRFESEPTRFSKQLSQMAQSACAGLLQGIESRLTKDADTRSRARNIVLAVLSAAYLALDKSQEPEASNVQKEAKDSDSGDVIKELLLAIDNTVFQLYLTIGVNPRLVREHLKPATDTTRQILFAELKDIFTNLTHPSSRRVQVLAPQTMHHMVEIFASTMSYDPALVLQFVADLLRTFSWGYQFDSMAKDEIVKFADALLADHKEILREPTNAINLESILALFVEAGWVEATQLLMKLDSAVR
jgi:hypothetical protein